MCDDYEELAEHQDPTEQPATLDEADPEVLLTLGEAIRNALNLKQKPWEDMIATNEMNLWRKGRMDLSLGHLESPAAALVSARDLAIAMYGEENSLVALNVAKGVAEARKTSILVEGYKSGAILGRNQSERELSEAAALMDDLEYQAALSDLEEAEIALRLAKLNVARYQAMLSMHKAWLYSQSDRE